jgi:hypothetical protein
MGQVDFVNHRYDGQVLLHGQMDMVFASSNLHTDKQSTAALKLRRFR